MGDREADRLLVERVQAGDKQAFGLLVTKYQRKLARLISRMVRDPAVHARVCDEIADFVSGLGFDVLGLIPSPIAGGDGNREFLIGARRR